MFDEVDLISHYGRVRNLTRLQEGICRQVPYGLVVRIPAFHAGGPGSIPGVGTSLFVPETNKKSKTDLVL